MSEQTQDQCPRCKATYYTHDDGNGDTVQVCVCNFNVGLQSFVYQSIFDPQSSVHVKVLASDAEQIFLDQCRAAYHMERTKTTIVIDGATKEVEITNNHTLEMPRIPSDSR